MSSPATMVNSCEGCVFVQQSSIDTSGNNCKGGISVQQSSIDTSGNSCEGSVLVQQSSIDTSGVLPPPSSTKTRKSTAGRRVSRKRNSVDTSSPKPDGEPGTAEVNAKSSRSRKRNTTKKVIEDDLTPKERAIPDTPLLRNLGKHPSVYARAGRGALTQNLNFRGAWPTALTLYRQANDEYKALFVAAGFGDFLKIDALHLPLAYLVALMERWFSETNTLHLPCCEIGPTPVDWTMITGLRFKGQRISLSPQYQRNRALELLRAGPEAITEGKIRLSSITPTVEEVQAAPANDEEKKIIFRRLFLYVVGSCFFSNNRSVINYELVQFLEQIDEVGCYDWGAITYAAFLAGMRRKVTREIGAFTGFWPFLLFWAFEYLDISRPNHVMGDFFPRATRWSFGRSFGPADFSEFVATRCQLDYVDASQVTWQPYLAIAEFHSVSMGPTLDLAKKRVPFESVDTWEYYLGERCRRQLGFPCRVPLPPPEKMHGGTSSEANPEDEICVGRSADSLVMDETVEYSSWFAAHSIGRIVDVSRFLGGLSVGGKIIDHWMVTHRPDMILIPKSEYKEIKEARDVALAECEKLREELVSSHLCRVKGGPQE